MPLLHDPLRLAADPRSVQIARQWVIEQFSELDRDDLIECAELGISELVTNALLHGLDPISVRVRGTREHPRIEVTDGSSRPPVPSGPPGEFDDLLATFGRGLGIVARSSSGWGASIESRGKVVWFEPSSYTKEDPPSPGEFFDPQPDGSAAQPSGERVSVLLLGIPIATTLGLQQQQHDLHREARLLSFTHSDTYPLASELTDVYRRLEGLFPPDILTAAQAAAAEGQESLDLHTKITREAVPVLEEFLVLMDRADEFCRAERLVSLARSSHQRRFQVWILEELIGQAAGHDPLRWSGRPGGSA